MKYYKLICIDNDKLTIDDKLVVNRKYYGKKCRYDNLYYYVYYKNRLVGLYPCNLFKTKVNYRKGKIK